MSFHRMLRAQGGFQKGWCVMQTILLLILLQLWRTPAEEQAAEQAVQCIYWVYVPDPPLLHPVSWKSPEVQIYSNDSDILGGPSEHLVIGATALCLLTTLCAVCLHLHLHLKMTYCHYPGQSARAPLHLWAQVVNSHSR